MTKAAAAAQIRAEGGGPSRDFDGGLLSRLTYSLTARDALAYLRLKRELPAWAKWALGVWFLLGGMAFGLLPEAVTGPPDSWRSIAVFLLVMALQAALALLARQIWRLYRAQHLIPHPVAAEFEEWIDCIAGTDLWTRDCAYLSPELIGQVLASKTHLFILNSDTAIIVPNHAFASPEDAKAMHQHLLALAKGPYYFDP
jgi:hypothetical protein